MQLPVNSLDTTLSSVGTNDPKVTRYRTVTVREDHSWKLVKVLLLEREEIGSVGFVFGESCVGGTGEENF